MGFSDPGNKSLNCELYRGSLAFLVAVPLEIITKKTLQYLLSQVPYLVTTVLLCISWGASGQTRACLLRHLKPV